MVRLVRRGLLTAQPERAGGKPVEATRVRITQRGCDDSARWRRYYEVIRYGWERALTSLKALLEE